MMMTMMRIPQRGTWFLKGIMTRQKYYLTKNVIKFTLRGMSKLEFHHSSKTASSSPKYMMFQRAKVDF